jgi:quercetin dioxygenase-like cupin family protein
MQPVLLLLSLLLAFQASAEPLLKASSSWDGGTIAYPPGQAEVTSIILRIEEGQDPPFHCHPVPTMGYTLQGVVEVETSTGKKITVKAGDPLVEVMRTVHRGRAVEGPAEILVFYAGAEGVPVTVFPEDDPEGKYCDF